MNKFFLHIMSKKAHFFAPNHIFMTSSSVASELPPKRICPINIIIFKNFGGTEVEIKKSNLQYNIKTRKNELQTIRIESILRKYDLARTKRDLTKTCADLAKTKAVLAEFKAVLVETKAVLVVTRAALIFPRAAFPQPQSALFPPRSALISPHRYISPREAPTSS